MVRLCVLLLCVASVHALAIAPMQISAPWLACNVCDQMALTLSEHCRLNSGESFNSTKAFVSRCFDSTLSLAGDYQTLNEKCEKFYSAVAEIYCPLDPCTHVTTAQQRAAPHAVCDILRCEGREEDSTSLQNVPTEPHACPVYVDAIVSACRQQKESGVEDPLPYAGCVPYAPRFEREGCDHVLSLMKQSVSPQPLCNFLDCNDFTSLALDDYCEKILHLPANTFVPAPAYMDLMGWGHDNHTTLQARGLRIDSATYGINCSESLNNNVLESVRADCQGKLECSFGNRNLAGMSSDWDVLKKDTKPTCVPGFTITYRCESKGPVQTIITDGHARFRAVPFGCV